MRLLTTATFTERACLIHGDMYDYSKVNYTGIRNKVEIVCPIHGSFWQLSANHLNQKQGCPHCGGRARITLDKFLQEAESIHGTTYDYSLITQINNNRDLLPIICRQHGPFRISPNKHLSQKSGCKICGNERKHGKRTSKKADMWLDTLGIDGLLREVSGLIPGRNYTVDGYDPKTRTAYEFHGDYWHGNPNKFPCDGIHPQKGRTYGELHQETVEKKAAYLEGGFNYVECWESEFKQFHAGI